MDAATVWQVHRAIAISALQPFATAATATDRQAAYRVLQELKAYDGRIALCISWLQQVEPIVFYETDPHHQQQQQPYDITTPTKLLALDVLDAFLCDGHYAKCNEAERLALREAVLRSARILATTSANNPTNSEGNTYTNSSTSSNSSSSSSVAADAVWRTQTRILARKLAVVLKGLILRDFPQRWLTLSTDLFAPGTGLWSCSASSVDNGSNSSNATTTTTTGVKICLECLKLVTEDCTDSDFNVKISTARRNDVLQGLNEISSTFLPLLFQVLHQNFATLQQSKAALHNMHLFLLSENRTIHSMTPPEATAYQKESQQRQDLALLLSDALRTLEQFCSTLPVAWMLGSGGEGDTSTATSTANNNLNANTNAAGSVLAVTHCDFLSAFLHLLREPDAQVQVRAVECLEQISLRGKLDFTQWMRLVRELPIAIQEANKVYGKDQEEYRLVELRATTTGSSNDGAVLPDPLTLQVDFHRALSKLLSSVVASHISHISSNKHILSGKGDFYESVVAFFRLLVDMLHHPSGRVLTEQINTWASLYRDPKIPKSGLLRPFCSELLTAFMDHMVRVRWVDVEDGKHPQSQLLEASFDDEEDFDSWINDFRSRCSILFRFVGCTEPQIAAEALNARVQKLLTIHGNGAPMDHLDTSNNQLTLRSEAVIQFEAIVQPLDNVMGGIPAWAMSEEPNQSRQAKIRDSNDDNRANIRAATRLSLSELCSALVSWQPSFVFLKFRHASLLDPLKHYWQHDPTTLLQGVHTLIRYLGLPDEWNAGGNAKAVMSGEIVSLKKRSGVALVAVAKKVPNHLVPWLSQLSQATRTLLSSDGLIPMNQMHLYEFLSCVATAAENPVERSNFIAEVLSDAVATLESSDVRQCIQSTSSFLHAMGVAQAADRPESVVDPANVEKVKNFYYTLFTPFNRLLSVGRRCNEAARQRSVLGGIAFENLPPSLGFGEPGQPAFPPDEGPLSLQDLAVTDPFVPMWTRILPTLLQVYDVVLSVWRPEHQAALFQNSLQRYVYAISDDEAFLARTQSSKSGGVFGEGGTAGSVVPGTDRREINLVPKWSGWFNELRNTCFQLMGLLAGSRALYAPELASLYPRIVAVLVDPLNLKSMEHRHFTQFLKHVVEMLLLTCPCSLYKTHLEPIIGPIFSHMRYRLEMSWRPVMAPTSDEPSPKALSTADCQTVAQIASMGEEAWFSWYYAHAGLFVGDLDIPTSEAAVEKHRVDIGRTFSDVLQSALALKGDWALVLANQARDEQALKKNDSTILTSGPRSRVPEDGVALNADGTPKLAHQALIDARKILRINCLCHFLLLESEGIAGNLTLALIQCLGYPDAYTCRRTVKICHRILETVAWSPQYSQLLSQQMFTQVVKNIVTEPKWMVGVEWDMINVVRDIYCRIVLGQMLQPGGQGPGLQQLDGQNNGTRYEQAKTVDKPLQGGGILVIPSDLPRNVLASLRGIGESTVQEFETAMKTKRSAKDQKDCIRDLLRTAADAIQQAQSLSSSGAFAAAAANAADEGTAAGSIFDRAVAEESLLHANNRVRVVPDLPERLVTRTQLNKKAAQLQNQTLQPDGLVALDL